MATSETSETRREFREDIYNKCIIDEQTSRDIKDAFTRMNGNKFDVRELWRKLVQFHYHQINEMTSDEFKICCDSVLHVIQMGCRIDLLLMEMHQNLIKVMKTYQEFQKKSADNLKKK